MDSKQPTPRASALPKVLRHRLAATSSPVPIGVDRNAGILIQEYWQHGKSHYAIACTSEHIESVEIRSREASSAGQLLGGPWPVTPAAVTCVALPALPSDGLMALFTDGTHFAGVLKVPVPPAPPIESHHAAVYTVDGLNGTGPKVPQMWCAQDALRYPAETETLLRLQLPAKIGTLTFSHAESGHLDEEVRVLSARCETLAIAVEPASILINTATSGEHPATHFVILSVKYPAVPGGQMLSRLAGRVRGPAGGTYPFLRGIIVGTS